jgi:hypothetical protein
MGVVGVLGLAFATLALFSLATIGNEVAGWFGGRDWPATTVRIDHLDLRSTTRKSGPKRLEVRYHYVVDDRRFDSTRVGWSDAVWVAFSNWPQDRYNELVDAGNQGRPVSAWYDPQDPASSVLDRSLRWGLLLFLLAVGAVTGLIARSALAVVRGLHRHDVPG